jgi:AAA15 family ATPase/GTPase
LRIRQIRIDHWRNFENIELKLPDDAGLVCLVGANGTGKTHLLELISACAHLFGLTPGTEIPRGSPFDDAHNLSVMFQLAEGVSSEIDEGLADDAAYASWDRTLTIESSRGLEEHAQNISAGGHRWSSTESSVCVGRCEGAKAIARR